MGLKEVAEELKDKIKEAEEAEGAVEKTEEEKPAVEEPKEEPAKEEKPEEEKKPDDKAPEAVKTPADYAKERREAKRSRDADDLAVARERIKVLEQQQQQKETKPADAEPSKEDDPQAWNEWKIRQLEEKTGKQESWTAEQERTRQKESLRQQAESELRNFEADTRKQNTDYDDVKNYYASVIAASLKIINPKITNDKLVAAVNDRLMMRASELFNEGYENPVAAMYEEAKALGYKPKAQAANDEGDEIKPDLAKVAANRARNAGTAGAQGNNGRGEMTARVAATLTNAEFAKLPIAERKRLLQQAG